MKKRKSYKLNDKTTHYKQLLFEILDNKSNQIENLTKNSLYVIFSQFSEIPKLTVEMVKYLLDNEVHQTLHFYNLLYIILSKLTFFFFLSLLGLHVFLFLYLTSLVVICQFSSYRWGGHSCDLLHCVFSCLGNFSGPILFTSQENVWCCLILINPLISPIIPQWNIFY